MKVDYGVRALVELAMHSGLRPLQTSEIAERQGIPEAYLHQLLNTMHKIGLINSRRGPHGGHSLAKDPKDINLGIVMASMEGNTPMLACLVEPSNCIHSSHCAQRDVWRFLDEAINDLLRNTTVFDLAQRQSHLTAQVTSQ